MTAVSWKFVDLGKVLLLNVAFFLILIGGIEYFSLSVFLELTFPHSLSVLAFFLIQSVALLVPLQILVIQKYQLSNSDLGFKKFSWGKTIASIILGYLSFLAVAYGLSILETVLETRIPGFEQQESALSMIGLDDYAIGVTILMVVIIAPLVEEIFFRGFVLRTLLTRYRPVVASLLSAAIFSASHLEFRSFTALFILGYIINQIYLKNRSVWPCVFFHMINNAITLSFQYRNL